jgi:hypothetical protein
VLQSEVFVSHCDDMDLENRWEYTRAIRQPRAATSQEHGAAAPESEPPLATLSSVVDTADPPSPQNFFLNHVLANAPLVLRGGARHWAAFRCWTPEALSRNHGDEMVSVAPLQPRGEHAFLDKWLEPAARWEHDEPDPEVVDEEQLLVVSAMRVKMDLRTFLSKLRVDEPHAQGSVGYYADGAGNLEHSFSFLRGDFETPAFASHLELKRADLWLGGRSISRMHYDNLDK